MDAHEYKEQGILFLELSGRVDEFHSEILKDELETMIKAGMFKIAIDLSDVTFISAPCLFVIWQVQKWAALHQGDVVFFAATAMALKIIESVEFDTVVHRFETKEEVLHYFENPDFCFYPKKKIKRGLFLKIIRILFFASFLGILTPQGKASDEFYLQDILSQVQHMSPVLKVARLQKMEKELDLLSSKTAYLPRIMASAGYFYQSEKSLMNEAINRELSNVRKVNDMENVENFNTKTKVSYSNDIFILGVGFHKIVFSGGYYDSVIELKESELSQQKAKEEIAELELEDQIHNLFFGLLLANNSIQYLNKQYETHQKQLEAATILFKMQTMGAVQYAEIEMRGLEIQRKIVQAQKDEKSLRGLLNISLGRNVDANLIPIFTESKREIQLQTPEHYFEIALHRYPDLKKAMALMKGSSAMKSMAESQKSLSLQGIVFGSGQYTSGLGEKDDLSWYLGFGVSTFLYDGGKSRFDIEKTESLLSQARTAYEESERKLQIRINEIVAEIQSAQIDQTLALKAKDLAQKRLEEAKQSVAIGQMPQYFESLAHTQVLEAELGVLSAESSLYKWISKLEMMTGRNLW